MPPPALPPVVDASGEPARALHARLERALDLLGVPPPRRVAEALRLTRTAAAAAGFEAALRAWEGAAATVLQREALLERLVGLRRALLLAQRGGGDRTRHDGDGGEGGLPLPTIAEARDLLWAFEVATAQVGAAAADLGRDCGGAPLLVDGRPYPGEGALRGDQLRGLYAEAAAVLPAA